MENRERTTLAQPQEGPIGVLVFRLEVASGSRAGQSIVLTHSRTTLGSRETCDLVLDDGFVSAEHCEIIQEQGGYFLKDLESRNGTFVNGLKIERIKLIPGALLRVGQTDLFFQINDSLDALPLYPDSTYGFLSGRSPQMRRLFSMLKQVAPTEISILIEGETGTGKDVLARSIHATSHRSNLPFVVVDCGAIAPSLIESHLFGHEKGAFTGAHQRSIGSFERAKGGTLFLDEIGELPIELQPKLLRALEQKEVLRVGGNETQIVDVRILAATNRNLAQEIQEGRFRQDLYYRLAVLRIQVPPLHTRSEDIPLMIETFLKEIPKIESVSAEALNLLVQHSWPGNIRELKNVVQRAAALSSGRIIQSEHIQFEPVAPRGGKVALPGTPTTQEQTVSLEEAERKVLLDTLKKCQWNKSEVAKRLGIASSTLYSKLKRHKIKDPTPENG